MDGTGAVIFIVCRVDKCIVLETDLSVRSDFQCMEDYSESVMAQRHLYPVLMCALSKGIIRPTEIHRYITNWGTISEKIDELVDAGLLELCPKEGRKTSKYYQLTEKGIFVVRMMRICDQAVKGMFDFSNGSVDEALKAIRS